MSCHWVYPLSGMPFFRCPRCGEIAAYGGRRSLWSLLPGVCRHVVQRWDERLEWQGRTLEHPGAPPAPEYDPVANLAYLDVGKTYPIKESKIKSFFRDRLSDELKGKRRFWWGPYTKEHLDHLAEMRSELWHV